LPAGPPALAVGSQPEQQLNQLNRDKAGPLAAYMWNFSSVDMYDDEPVDYNLSMCLASYLQCGWYVCLC